jgi:hypothetical protein
MNHSKRRGKCPHCNKPIYIDVSKAPDVKGYDEVKKANAARAKIDKKLIPKLYLEGLTVAEVAGTLKCTAEYVRQVLKGLERDGEI